MIEKNSHSIHRIVALLVVLTFILPAGISFVHAIQGHDHSDSCTYAGETHVHEIQLDCDLGDLQTVKIDFYAFAKADTPAVPLFLKIIDNQLVEVYTATTQTLSSRGPPIC